MATGPLGIYLYPWDILDEGIDTVLENVQRAGLDTLYITTWYHSGMFFLPHNPKRKIYFPESGAMYFKPSEWHDTHSIVPSVSNLSQNWTDFWHILRQACDARGLKLSAWMPILHNSGAAQKYPQFSVKNAWDDPISHSLCPAHSEVRELVEHIVKDLVNLSLFDRILLESIEYLPLRHGYHHEVIGMHIEEGHEFLLSLCFCDACKQRAKNHGLDVNSLQSWLKQTCQNSLNVSQSERLGWPELEQSHNELEPYLELRKLALTELLQSVRAITQTQTDLKLAILDFGPLYSLGPRNRSWQNGVDLTQQLPFVDEVHPTFYFTDPAILRAKIDEYAKVLAGQKPIIPAIRAILPQTTNSESLKEQIQATKNLARGYTFYNYSFMSLQTLDWIRNVIT